MKIKTKTVAAMTAVILGTILATATQAKDGPDIYPPELIEEWTMNISKMLSTEISHFTPTATLATFKNTCDYEVPRVEEAVEIIREDFEKGRSIVTAYCKACKHSSITHTPYVQESALSCTSNRGGSGSAWPNDYVGAHAGSVHRSRPHPIVHRHTASRIPPQDVHRSPARDDGRIFDTERTGIEDTTGNTALQPHAPHAQQPQHTRNGSRAAGERRSAWFATGRKRAAPQWPVRSSLQPLVPP